MKRTGVLAGILAVVAAGAFATGARGLADANVFSRDANGPCFSSDPAATECAVGETATVNITTGDSVTWHFSGVVAHNAAAANDVPADPTWKDYVGDFVTTGEYEREFTQPGDYEFVCQAHPEMTGTIHVTGPPVGGTTTPAPGTPTPTSTPQPGGGNTPPPSAQPDKIRPTVRRMRLKALRRAARITFRLSEAATITVRVKRGRRVIASKRYQVQAGTRTVTVRSRKLKKGRYTLEVLARDAAGNRSVAARGTLRIKR